TLRQTPRRSQGQGNAGRSRCGTSRHRQAGALLAGSGEEVIDRLSRGCTGEPLIQLRQIGTSPDPLLGSCRDGDATPPQRRDNRQRKSLGSPLLDPFGSALFDAFGPALGLAPEGVLTAVLRGSGCQEFLQVCLGRLG